MCLSTVNKRYKKPSITKKWRVGYKVFKTSGKWFRFYCQDNSLRMTYNKIYTSTNDKIQYYNKYYKSGFHIFENLNDAICWRWICYNSVVKKVFFNNVVVIGKQDNKLTYVARKMKISRAKV